MNDLQINRYINKYF